MLTRVFFSQRSEDQRHAFDVWRRVDGDPVLAEAALLHDVGKVASDLGAIARSSATVLGMFRVPTTGRWKSYLDHGRLGAEVLTVLGASHFAIQFTMHHPSGPPRGVDSLLWKRLEEADG